MSLTSNLNYETTITSNQVAIQLNTSKDEEDETDKLILPTTKYNKRLLLQTSDNQDIQQALIQNKRNLLTDATNDLNFNNNNNNNNNTTTYDSLNCLNKKYKLSISSVNSSTSLSTYSNQADLSEYEKEKNILNDDDLDSVESTGSLNETNNISDKIRFYLENKNQKTIQDVLKTDNNKTLIINNNNNKDKKQLDTNEETVENEQIELEPEHICKKNSLSSTSSSTSSGKRNLILNPKKQFIYMNNLENENENEQQVTEKAQISNSYLNEENDFSLNNQKKIKFKQTSNDEEVQIQAINKKRKLSTISNQSLAQQSDQYDTIDYQSDDLNLIVNDCADEYESYQDMTNEYIDESSNNLNSKRIRMNGSNPDSYLLKNYLFRTMNEILTSQLLLTRKVDQIRENHFFIFKKLKGIELSLKQNNSYVASSKRGVNNEINSYIYSNQQPTNEHIISSNSVVSSSKISRDKMNFNTSSSMSKNGLNNEMDLDDSFLEERNTNKSVSSEPDTLIKSEKTIVENSPNIHKNQKPFSHGFVSDPALQQSHLNSLNKQMNYDSNSTFNSINSGKSFTKLSHNPTSESLNSTSNDMNNKNNENSSLLILKSLTKSTNVKASPLIQRQLQQHQYQYQHNSSNPQKMSQVQNGLATHLNLHSPNTPRLGSTNTITKSISNGDIDNSLISHKTTDILRHQLQSSAHVNSQRHPNLQQYPYSLGHNSHFSSHSPAHQTAYSNQHNSIYHHSNQHQSFMNHYNSPTSSLNNVVTSSQTHHNYNHHLQNFQQQITKNSSHAQSNMVTTSPNNGSNSNTNSKAAALAAAAAVAAAMAASASQTNNQSYSMHEYTNSIVNGNENNSNNDNDEQDYESAEDENSPYQIQNIDTNNQFNLIRPNAPIRHIPSSIVDQLELNEEVEALVSRDVIKRCIRKAKHRGNFAANLAAEIFTKEERITCNCTGTRGKRQLSPRRLQIVKEITYRMYNSNAVQAAAITGGQHSAAALLQDFEEAWRKECITAIDAKNRSIGRDLIKNNNSNNNNNNNNNNNIQNGYSNGLNDSVSPSISSTTPSNITNSNNISVNEIIE